MRNRRRVWEREWRHFPTPPCTPMPFSRENKTRIQQWYRVIEPGALSATQSYASEFASWKKMQATPTTGGSVYHAHRPRNLTLNFRPVCSFFFLYIASRFLSLQSEYIFSLLFHVRKLQLKRTDRLNNWKIKYRLNILKIIRICII